jgi:biofilm PGA synthesis N-glycosyltransferase PgaC
MKPVETCLPIMWSTLERLPRAQAGVPAEGDVATITNRTVAALIPAKDEEHCIAKTIRSLAVDQGVEHVYVVSDGSSDRTAKVASETGAQVLELETNVGKALAIKKALEHFGLCEHYPYVGIFDSDVICEPGYLPSCAARFQAGIACVIGRIDTLWVPKNGWVAYRTFAIWNYQWSMRRPQSVLKAINITPGSNSVFRADVLARIDWDECVRYRTADQLQRLLQAV